MQWFSPLRPPPRRADILAWLRQNPPTHVESQEGTATSLQHTAIPPPRQLLPAHVSQIEGPTPSHNPFGFKLTQAEMKSGTVTYLNND